MEVQLKETERIDDLQLKGLKLIQDTNGFCFGIDAVLLANFAKVKKGAKVVDLGTGTGIVPILIAGKSQASKIIGVEIQEEVYEMATRSVKLNDLEERVEIVNADIKEIDKEKPTRHKYDEYQNVLLTDLHNGNLAQKNAPCSLSMTCH